MQIGFDGIKMLETKPTEQKSYAIEIDDPYFDGLFSACETNSTPMIWHVADPASFWDINRIPKRFLDRGWFFGDGTYMTHDRIYAQVYNVLERHPRLKVTFAHFFFMSETPEALETLFKKYPGVSVDITPGAEMYADFRKNHSYYRDFFIKYADRIMLGTDTSVNGGDMTRFSQRCQAVRDFITTNQDVFIIAHLGQKFLLRCFPVLISLQALDMLGIFLSNRPDFPVS
jgi:predicted TIM-barrel fold metal-dependent hydrolase